MHVRLRSALAALVLTAADCASTEAFKAARNGDLASLKRILGDDFQKRTLDAREARGVARATVKHELETETGEAAAKRVDELWLCATKLEGALEERAKKDDEAAAKAAYVLVDLHLVSPSKWAEKTKSADGAWRAVGARSMVGEEHAAARKALYLDLDPRVRRGAVEAAADAPGSDDATALLEIVRVDPDPAIRVAAARAAGSIGGRDVVFSLKDRWPAADETLRAAIAQAWAEEKSYSAGGKDELVWAAETEHGVPAITAAVGLRRHGGEEAQIGRAGIVRAIEEGAAESRIVAIHLATLADEGEKAAIAKAAQEQDLRVKVAALGKMALDPSTRAKALEELGPIAAGDSIGANAARSAMAAVGDRRVVELLSRDETGAKEPGVRAWAGCELARMKEFPRAAQALADEDASVRTRVSCAILAVP